MEDVEAQRKRHWSQQAVFTSAYTIAYKCVITKYSLHSPSRCNTSSPCFKVLKLHFNDVFSVADLVSILPMNTKEYRSM